MEEDTREEIFQTPSQFESRINRQTPSSGTKRYLVILILIIVIGLVIFGVTRFFSAGENTGTDLTPTPTEEFFPTDTPTPTEDVEEEDEVDENEDEDETPTPKPTSNPVDKTTGLDRSDLSIHILNGNGVSGASKEASDFLEGLGYNVVQIGNADNFDYTDTEIQIKNASKEFLDLLKKDLNTKYTVGSTSDTPPSDETADAVVIIGG